MKTATPRQRTSPENRITMMLSPTEREYIGNLWTLMRTASSNATAASQKYRAEKAAFGVKAKKMGWIDNPAILAKRQDESFYINDAYFEYEYWRDEAMRIATQLNAELAVRTILSGPVPHVQ